jgi:uncharacterized damage-inducible protein DinB
MSRGEQIAQMIERAVTGPVWHGPALTDLIGDVSAEHATQHPIAGAHSIWELVVHVASWADIVRRRLASRDPIEATDAEDWPAIPDRSADAWRAAVERLKESHRELAGDVATLADAELDARAPGRDHSTLVMLHGIVEHAAYHGGQIALLKKAIVYRT